VKVEFSDGGEAHAGAVVAKRPEMQVLSVAKAALNREINTSRFTVEEARERLRKGDSFLKDVMKGPKIPIIGTEDELAGVLGLRKAEAPQGRRRINRQTL